MPIMAEKEMQHIGETSGAANHDHDMIHDLSKRLDALWRYDQYIANAKDDQELSAFWNDVKQRRTKRSPVKRPNQKTCPGGLLLV